MVFLFCCLVVLSFCVPRSIFSLANFSPYLLALYFFTLSDPLSFPPRHFSPRHFLPRHFLPVIFSFCPSSFFCSQFFRSHFFAIKIFFFCCGAPVALQILDSPGIEKPRKAKKKKGGHGGARGKAQKKFFLSCFWLRLCPSRKQPKRQKKIIPPPIRGVVAFSLPIGRLSLFPSQ